MTNFIFGDQMLGANVGWQSREFAEELSDRYEGE